MGWRRQDFLPSEAEEQAQVIAWAQWASALPAWRATHGCLALLFAVPNAGLRTYATANWLQKQGMKAGVPDLCLPVARGRYHGLFIEMKRQKGGRVNAGQQWWGTMLREQGYLCVVTAGADRAIARIEEYLRGADDGEGRPVSEAGGSQTPAVRIAGDGG